MHHDKMTSAEKLVLSQLSKMLAWAFDDEMLRRPSAAAIKHEFCSNSLAFLDKVLDLFIRYEEYEMCIAIKELIEERTIPGPAISITRFGSSNIWKHQFEDSFGSGIE